MSPRKINKPKRIRPDHTALMKIAAAYRCGHCWSEVGTSYDTATGMDRVQVAHDHSCPVLLGALTDVPDTLRAVEEVGGIVITGADGRVIAALYLKGDAT